MNDKIGTNGQGEDSEVKGFQPIITIQADEKGNWKMDFKIHPDAVLLFLQKIQFNMLSGQFKVKKEDKGIVAPTPQEVQAVS